MRVVSARARARGDSGACAVSGVAIGVRGPPAAAWAGSAVTFARTHCEPIAAGGVAQKRR